MQASGALHETPASDAPSRLGGAGTERIVQAPPVRCSASGCGTIVSLEKLAGLGESTITPEVLRKAGVIKGKAPVKILGDGELTSAITVQAHKFSKSAQEKITKAGGKFEVLQ